MDTASHYKGLGHSRRAGVPCNHSGAAGHQHAVHCSIHYQRKMTLLKQDVVVVLLCVAVSCRRRSSLQCTDTAQAHSASIMPKAVLNVR